MRGLARHLLPVVLLLALAAPAPAQGTAEPEQPGVGGLIGSIVGALLGGWLGGQASDSAVVRGAAAAVGAALGAWFGDDAYAWLTAADRELATQAEARALEAGTTVSWRNPDSGASGRVVTEATDGEGDCRSFRHLLRADDGTERQVDGRACRNPDGSWRVVGG